MIVSQPHFVFFCQLGKTEVVKDSLNPEFGYSLIVDYRFEEVQNMVFYVIDSDGKAKREDNDALGEVSVFYFES